MPTPTSRRTSSRAGRPVVRVLVVLGQPVERAEDVAVAAFARLLPDWDGCRREVDVDVELARVVLDGWVRDTRRRAGASRAGAGPRGAGC